MNTKRLRNSPESVKLAYMYFVFVDRRLNKAVEKIRVKEPLWNEQLQRAMKEFCMQDKQRLTLFLSEYKDGVQTIKETCFKRVGLIQRLLNYRHYKALETSGNVRVLELQNKLYAKYFRSLC